MLAELLVGYLYHIGVNDLVALSTNDGLFIATVGVALKGVYTAILKRRKIKSRMLKIREISRVYAVKIGKSLLQIGVLVVERLLVRARYHADHLKLTVLRSAAGGNHIHTVVIVAVHAAARDV